MNDISDAQLVRLAQNGDEHALETIFQRYKNNLYYTAYKITNNREDAQDALQDTFLQVSQSIQNVKRPEYVKLWMNRIIAGKCRDIFRKNKTLSFDVDDYKFQNKYTETDKDYIPEQSLHFQTDRELVNSFIAALPYVQREAIILAYFQYFSMQEIADILDEPIGTVKSRIHLAKKTLKQNIRSYEEREHVKVNFRLSNLHTILLAGFTATYGGSATTALGTSNTTWSSFSSLTHTAIGKVAVASIITLSAGGGVYAFQESQKQTQLPLEQSSYIPSNLVIFEERKVESDQDAYFILMNWAMNEQQMKLKTVEELNMYRPIYEYLKSRNSNYYKALKQNGMTNTLENYF